MADLTAHELDGLRALLPGAELAELAHLGGSDRSDVRRVRAAWPDRATTLVAKQYAAFDEGWVRESSALAIMPPDAPAAQLVAAATDPALIVMSDLGDGGNVADALLGDDPDAAADAVLLWARTTGVLHRGTLALEDAFRAELRARSRDLSVTPAATSLMVDDALRLLEDHCGRLGVPMPSGSAAELRELPRRLDAAGASALSPGDTCPDNNVRAGDAMALVDFEGACWRHVVWDVAYLTVPWPSCWCSWRLPGDLTERAIERYRSAIEDDLPYVRSPEFRHDVAAATTGWALVSTAWFLTRALEDTAPSPNPLRPTPSRRAAILHRLAGAQRSAELPRVAALAANLREALVERWGEVPLSYAPAFRED